jgi:hypothetical protein
MSIKRVISSLFVAASLALSVSAMVPAPARAASLPTPVTQFAACDAGSFFGFPTWYACLPKDSDGHPKLTKLEDVWLIAFPLLETGIKAAAYVAVGFILWGGIRFIKSQGNPGEITASRDTIRDALIGLVICVSSVAIVQFMASRL